MSKHLWTHTSKQGVDISQAESTYSILQSLVDRWTDLDIGPFPDHILNGDPARSRSGCSSCQGMRNYTQGEKLIQDYLLDQAGAVSVGGGLKLSRERLRDVLELPAPEKIKAFEEVFQRYRRDSLNRYRSIFVEIRNGEVVFLKDELEEYLKTYEKHISNPDDIKLLEDLEAFVSLTQSLNERLQKRNMRVIGLNYKPGMLDAVVKVHDNKPYLDKELLSSYLR